MLASKISSQVAGILLLFFQVVLLIGRGGGNSIFDALLIAYTGFAKIESAVDVISSFFVYLARKISIYGSF